MPIRFSVLGSGAWGATIALLLAQKHDHSVSIWCPRSETAKRINESRENLHLPGITIPATIDVTADFSKSAQSAELLILAIPTVYLRSALMPVAAGFPTGCPLLSLVKGLERDTLLRPSEIVRDIAGSRRSAVLSGPNHAEEIVRGLPTSAVVASDDISLARWIQESFSTERFRVYTNLDLVGVEYAGGLKNVIAIAAGVGDGMQLGDNAKASLLTRGLAEMCRFGLALGAEPETFYGLAGIGDLIATCISPHGRNRHVGVCLGKGEKLDDILGSMNMVAEGVNTTQSVYEKARQLGIAMPITEAVHRILYEGMDPRDAVTELMLREPKSEK